MATITVESFLQRIEQIGKQTDVGFKVSSVEMSIIKDLIGYFSHFDTSLNRNKGIMLSGIYGQGKTLYMNIFQKMLAHQPKKKIIKKSNNWLIDEYQQNGPGSIKVYKTIDNLFIDDLGTSEGVKIYGTKADDVMDSFLQSRYDAFQNKGTITHITTNLTDEEIVNRYGQRVYDRFTEMFNKIVWPELPSRRFSSNPAPKSTKVGQSTEKHSNCNIADKKQVYRDTINILWTKQAEKYIKTSEYTFQTFSMHAIFQALWVCGLLTEIVPTNGVLKKYMDEGKAIVNGQAPDRTIFQISKEEKNPYAHIANKNTAKPELAASKLIVHDYLMKLKDEYQSKKLAG